MTADVFLWTLEILGPDCWQSLDEYVAHELLHCCIVYGRKDGALRLLELCNHGIDARSSVDGYSSLHVLACDGRHLEFPLTLGANVNLVGFDPESSPWPETPLSLSMYCASTFVALKRELESTGARLDAVVDEALKTYPFQNFPWTEETLMELLSMDLDFLPIVMDIRPVCPYCLGNPSVMVQPCWMHILVLILRRTGSQSIQNVIENVLFKGLGDFKTDAVSGDDDGNEKASSHTQMQIQDNAFSEEEDQQFTAQFYERMSIEFSDGRMGSSDFYYSVSVEDEDMCLFCWQKWMDTGLKPLVDERKCLCCGLRFSSEECYGKTYGELWCWECDTKKRHGKRARLAKVESDEDEDDYSPYLIHT